MCAIACDVSFGRDVRFARDAEHITSLCTEGAIHHCAKHNITCHEAAYITTSEANVSFESTSSVLFSFSDYMIFLDKLPLRW